MGYSIIDSINIVISGRDRLIYVLQAEQPLSDYSFSCKFFFSPRIVAKAYELALNASLRGKSLKNLGLEFLRRLLIVKQVKDVLETISNTNNSESNCYISVIESDINNKLVLPDNDGKLPEKINLQYPEAIDYYKKRLCLHENSVEDIEELVIAYQALTAEDRWPKC